MNWLSRLALRSIPADWRDAVERDLLDEQPAGAGSVWFTRRALGIGARLRLNRSFERIGRLRSIRQARPMRDLGRDIHFAIRSAIRQPGYAFAIIATLAIGIGANTAIFSVFNWIMFRPLPGVARPNELITIRYQIPQSSGRFFVPYGDYVDLRDGVPSIASLAASLPLTMHLGGGDSDEGTRLEGEIVTTNYFEALGVSPAVGRGFRPDEERTLVGTPPVVISHGLWQRAFEGRGDVIGQTIRIDGDPFIVVGITPPGFQGRSLVSVSDLWVPVGAHPVLLPNYPSDLLRSRKSTLFGDAIGRLRRGVSLEQAQAEALAVAEGSPEFAVRGPNNRRSSIRPVLYAGIGHDTYAVERLRTTFTLLMGAVGLVLLLACANAANLFLARTASRRREIAVRQAIGARRIHIVRQHLVEGLLLALSAGLAGIVLASWLTSLFDGMRILTFLPAIEGVQVDWRVAAFALAASLVTAVGFSAVPAVAGSRVDLLESLKDGLTSSRRGRGLLRGGLVVLQITVSLGLLGGAGLFLRTLQNIRSLDLGVDTRGLVEFPLDPSRLGHDQWTTRKTGARCAAR